MQLNLTLTHYVTGEDELYERDIPIGTHDHSVIWASDGNDSLEGTMLGFFEDKKEATIRFKELVQLEKKMYRKKNHCILKVKTI